MLRKRGRKTGCCPNKMSKVRERTNSPQNSETTGIESKRATGCRRFSDTLKSCFGRKRCRRHATPESLQKCRGRVRVCKVRGDRKICAKMAAMGVYPGVEADIICAEEGSRCLLKVHGGTISLDPALSENIIVTSV
ncbi:FeoA family protein [Desulfomarina sp.]